MRLTYWTAALLFASTLGGCIDGEALNEGTVDTTRLETGLLADGLANISLDPANASIDAPVWEVGYAWTVTSNGFVDEVCTLPVVAAGGTYRLATTCQAQATGDAVFDMSYIGPIRASDLAGAQHGTPVQFFSFPLTDGKTWTTKWDGKDITITASFTSSLPSPVGNGPGFNIIAKNADGDLYATYDYSPMLKWWTKIDFAEGYGIRVDKFEPAWSGLYYEGSGAVVYSQSVPGFFVPGTFKVAEDAHALVLTFHGQADGFTFAIQLIDPEGTMRYQYADTSTSGGVNEYFVELPAIPGEWKVAGVGSYNPQQGGFVFDVYEVHWSEKTLGQGCGPLRAQPGAPPPAGAGAPDPLVGIPFS